MFLKKSILFKKYNRTFCLNDLFNTTHTILAMRPIHKDGKTPNDFSFQSMLKKLLRKTGVGRKR